MRISKLTWIIVLIGLTIGLDACSGSPAQTPSPTRAATQTPWIIYVPVTSTPEPATVTPLPTVTAAGPARAPTKPPATRPPATKAPPTAAPAAAAPTASPAPACNLGTARPTFPENGSPRSANGAIIFKWDPPGTLSGIGDSHVGYMIQMQSRRGGQLYNGDTVYVSHNKYFQDSQFTYDRRAVASLAGGDTATLTWNVTVVKTSGSFNDNDYTVRPPDLIKCGSPSEDLQVQLIYNQ